MLLRLVGKNSVIGMATGEGRSRLALNSSSLIEEGLKKVLSQSPDVLEREEISTSGLRIGVEFTGQKFAESSL